MPCRPILVFEWSCHGCQATEWRPERGLPSGWSDHHVARLGPYAKQLDLCPACSADSGAIIRTWRNRFSSFGPTELAEHQEPVAAPPCWQPAPDSAIATAG